MNQLLLKILDPNLARVLPGFRKKNHINRYLEKGVTSNRETAANQQNRYLAIDFIPGFASAINARRLNEAREILLAYAYPQNKEIQYKSFLKYFGRSAISVKRRPFYFGSIQVFFAKVFPELFNFLDFAKMHEGHDVALPKMVKNMVSSKKEYFVEYTKFVYQEIKRLKVSEEEKKLLTLGFERHVREVQETAVKREQNPDRYKSKIDQLSNIQFAARQRLDVFLSRKLGISEAQVKLESQKISKKYIEWALTYITDDLSMRTACGGSILHKIYYLTPRQNYEKFSINWQDALVKLFPAHFSSKEDLVIQLNKLHPHRRFYVLQKRAA